jgi:hypothetical protein
MTLALATSLNAVLMLALLGALSVLMSRAVRLKPHMSATVAPVLEPVPARRTPRARRIQSTESALAVAGR